MRSRADAPKAIHGAIVSYFYDKVILWKTKNTIKIITLKNHDN